MAVLLLALLWACGSDAIAPSISVSPSRPDTTVDLVADVSPARAELQWFRDGVRMTAFTGTRVSASATARGDVWYVRAVDGGLGALSGSVRIANSAPVVSSVRLSTDAPVAGEDELVCAVDLADADADAVHPVIRWLRDGSSFDGAADGRWPGDTVPARALAVDELWQCVVLADDGDLQSGPSTVSAVVRAADAPELPDAPFDEPLLANAGFEDGELGPWELVEGLCTLSEGEWLDPYEGGWMLYGGDGAAGDCRVRQRLDLEALGFAPGWVDLGGVGVDLGAWLANSESIGSFDDQVRVRIAFVGADETPLGSLETLIGGDVAWRWRGAVGLVPPGTVALDVDVEARFRRNPDNNSLADALELTLTAVEPSDPGVSRLPMLQDHRADAMRVLWETDGNHAVSRVTYSPLDGGDEAVVVDVRTIQVTESHFVHVADMTGLETGATYTYTVQSGATGSDSYVFRSAPSLDAPTSVAWLGDNQEGAARFRTHVAHMSARAPDMLIVPGDLVSLNDVLDEWRDYWWAPLEERSFGSTTPVLVARGNHDRHHPYAYAYLALPENEYFYSFRYGSVFYVVLDTQAPMSMQPSGMDQQTYLQAALASDDALSADFRVVSFHQAPYSNARQDSSDGNAGAREAWVEIMEAGGVDLMIGGHYHSYQRGDLNGIQYVIVGGGGSSLLATTEELWEFFDVVELTWHYSIMNVEDGILQWSTYDLDDQLMDTFTLQAR